MTDRRPKALSYAACLLSLCGAVPSAAITPDVASSSTHTLALDGEGRVFAWGNDSYGQLGLGRAIIRTTPTRVPGLPAISQVSLGAHALALDVFGQVWSWGDGTGGALGARESSALTQPARVAGAVRMTRVAAGEGYSLALRSDGTVWGWGRVPLSGGEPWSAVRQIPGLSGIVEIAAGTYHALALRIDGTAFAFGRNQYGELGRTPVGGSDFRDPGIVSGVSGVVAISAGTFASVALTADGTVVFWGLHKFGTEVHAPTALPGLGGGARFISHTHNGVYAARADGTVFRYEPDAGPWAAQAGFAGIAKVQGSIREFVFGIDGSGQLFAKGNNDSGQLGLGDTAARAVATAVPGFASTAMVAAFERSSLALRTDGSLWFFGADDRGQSGDASSLSTSFPQQVPLPAVIKAIAAGPNFSAALDTAGNAWAWGRNESGAYGVNVASRSIPATVAGISNVQAIAAGGAYLLYLMADGSVRVSGTFYFPYSSPTDPLAVSGLSGIVAIAAGGSSGYALRTDGVLLAWGNNANGQLGNGTTDGNENVTPAPVNGLSGTVTRIAAYGLRASAVTADGRVWSWGAAPNGNGTFGSVSTPTAVGGIIDAADVSVGGDSTLVLRRDGSIVAWGYTYLSDAVGRDNSLPYPVAFHESAAAVRAGDRSGFIIGNKGVLWGFGTYFGNTPTMLYPTIGDGTYVPRNRPVVLLAAGGAGSVDANNWYLDLDSATMETIPAAFVPKSLALARIFGSEAGVGLDSTVKYRSGDIAQSRRVNNYVLGLVPPAFFDLVQASPYQAKLARPKLKSGHDLVLAQLTPAGWSVVVGGQLIPYSQAVANAAGGAANILNGVNGNLLQGARFCIGYGESAQSMLEQETLREVLVLQGAAGTASGLPCVLTGVYVDGPATSTAGSPATFNASVVGVQPTGTVQFKDAASALLGPATLSPSNAAVAKTAITTSSLAAGEHSIGASYSGDSQNAARSAEFPLRHEVRAASPGNASVEISGPASSALASTAVFTARVTGANPTGTVQFRDGAANLGAAEPVVAGAATLRIATLGVGSHSMSATYSGDSANVAAASTAIAHSVFEVINTGVALSVPESMVDFGASVTFTARVSGTNPTGSVVVRDDGAVLGTANLVNGSASVTVPNLAAGLHWITATYSGDAANQSFTSAPVLVAVRAPTQGTSTNPPRLANISTRMAVLTGDNVLIGGFIVGGLAPKTVVVRARGPSLAAAGVPNVLVNPVMNLYSGQTVIASNDDWQSAANAATIQSSGFAPLDPRESAIYITLNPGPYTAIVTGADGTTGVGIVEAFEVDDVTIPLINIATRGPVLTGDNVMIGGFIIQGNRPQTVVVRARGPSLAAFGVPNVLVNPVLSLFSGQTVIASNDDWQTAANAATLQSSGFAPADANEAAILITLNPGAYTAIVSGVGGVTGAGIVEVFTVP